MARRVEADSVVPVFNGIQHPKKRAFLQALARTCSITRAAEAAKIDRTLYYVWMRRDADFAKEFDRAKDLGAKALEAEAIRRANEGWEEPVFHQGKVVGKVRRYDSTLLIFLLKGAMPEKYRERWSGELTGKDGKPLLDLASVRAFVAGDKEADE